MLLPRFGFILSVKHAAQPKLDHEVGIKKEKMLPEDFHFFHRASLTGF